MFVWKLGKMVRRDRSWLLSRLSQESAQEVSGAIKKLVGSVFGSFCPLLSFTFNSSEDV